MADDGHRYQFVVVIEFDAPHAGRIPAFEHTNLAHREADALTARRREQDVIGIGADRDIGNRLSGL